MNSRRLRLLLVLLATSVVPALVWLGLYAGGLVPGPGKPLVGDFNLSDRLVGLEIVDTPAGPTVLLDDGRSMTAEAFLEEVAQRKAGRGERGWFYAVLDITNWTGLIWVGLGLFGQVLFTGRMLVQWLASEREQRSVVPVSFWWLSLFGASMLIVYFIWRIDIVGVLGQATGWLIYVRNLWFIHKPKPLNA